MNFLRRFDPAIRLLGCLLLLAIVFTLQRVALTWFNLDRIADSPEEEILNSFLTGIRFDLRVACISVLPLIFLPVFQQLRFRG